MNKTRQAYSEIDEFLGLLSEEKRNEIPKKLRDFFKDNKDKEYHKNINKDIPIKDQNLLKETLAIIASLNLKYWCKDENEKKRLKQIYAKNEKKYKEMLYEKYNPNELFKKKNIEEKNMKIVKYRESFFKNIINKIISFLHLR